MARVDPRAGTFFVVGLGTAPDLMTLRAAEVIAQSPVILLEDGFDETPYRERLRQKEIWVVPHYLRVFYGIDEQALSDPDERAAARRNAADRRALADKITEALASGRSVAFLQAGDPMMYGTLFLLELLPPGTAKEVIPGVGAFSAATAAVLASPSFGFDTSSVILTMADWPGRGDRNEKLMATGTSMVFYTMHLDLPDVFAELGRHYPAETPVALVANAGSRAQQRVFRSSVGRFLDEVDPARLPTESALLLVGKFLTVGQARKDGVQHGRKLIEAVHGGPPVPKARP